jgi:hypothetical protein
LAKALAALAIGVSLQCGSAAASDIVGSWSGSGTVTLASGATEKARCRASFIAAGGKTYAMSATCATSAAKVSQTAIVSQNTKNRYGGTFYNPEFGVSGRIRIIVNRPSTCPAARAAPRSRCGGGRERARGKGAVVSAPPPSREMNAS